ncbi:MAG: hypothetical protein U0X75_04505 [Acidobacteriota bacterium]
MKLGWLMKKQGVYFCFLWLLLCVGRWRKSSMPGADNASSTHSATNAVAQLCHPFHANSAMTVSSPSMAKTAAKEIACRGASNFTSPS